MKLYCEVARIRPYDIENYKKLYSDMGPEISHIFRQCNIRNYGIYLKKLHPGYYYLFRSFEYIGSDYEADMKKMAANPNSQKWYEACKPYVCPVEELPHEEAWATAEEIFHQDSAAESTISPYR